MKRILIDGGYVEGGVYYFYLTDHLGNNRVVANATGTPIQKNHYYPFGTPFAETSKDEQGKQPYKYNGKEYQQMHGLNLYDYSARQMEAAIGRFTSVDPLAEMKPWLSPYHYCSNNPVNRIDPTGMADVDTQNRFFSEHFGELSNLERQEAERQYWFERERYSNFDKTELASPTDVVTKDGQIIGHYNDGENALYCAEELDAVYVTPYGGGRLPISIGGTTHMYNLNTGELDGAIGEVGLQSVHPEFEMLFLGRSLVNSLGKLAFETATKNVAADRGKTIIGETMVRVETAARGSSNSFIVNDMPVFTGTSEQITSQMMTYNRQWILQQMRSGRPIIDIGSDPSRKIPSIFYQMEQNMLRNYQKLHPGSLNIIKP